MTNQDARAVFDAEIALSSNADRTAKLELLREYFTNPTFQKWLSEFVWRINHR